MTGFILWIMATLAGDTHFRSYPQPDLMTCEVARQLTESAMREAGYQNIETRCTPDKLSTGVPLT